VGKEVNEKGRDEVHLYRASGIQERQGGIPLWLKLVVVALLLWSLYYMVMFWNF
jgi:hypothetical protein